MATTQADRPLTLTTPLGQDKLLLLGLSGTEALSQLFHFRLQAVAENGTTIAFDQLLGQQVSVKIKWGDGKNRYFNGICQSVAEAGSDDRYTTYFLEIVPKFWLLTKRTQSRIFQHKNVPDILKAVLEGLDVSYEIQGTFHPRDYCVQYRESDFHFASRLMQEEGIYYYFKHTADGHKMVVANTPPSHVDVPESAQITFDRLAGGSREAERIWDWEKMQELRSSKVTLWDHCFEKPNSHLDSTKDIVENVQVGTVSHKQKLAVNGPLEQYDFPGAYAQRFDGIDRGGGERPADIEKIFEDNARTVGIRMQEEAAGGITIRGAGNAMQFTAGHKFQLQQHANANGPYVLTSVEHFADMSSYVAGGTDFRYQNSFSCIPAALPFRPQRSLSKPTVHGSQTAVVVGPQGEEIFCDKYGRIKVQFHWDRQGVKDADSSCWVRVGTCWAGKQWGMIHIPRIGQEVIVDFEEGDPDQPIVIGSVYNAEMMPPYLLPDNKTQSGLKSRSSLNGSPANYNEIRFEDKKGEEEILIHAEKDQRIEVENDETHVVEHDRNKTVNNNETTAIGANRTETVGKDENVAIKGNRSKKVDKDETIQIGANFGMTIAKDTTLKIDGNSTSDVGKDEKSTVGGDRVVSVVKNDGLDVKGGRSASVKKNDSLNVGQKLTIEAGDEIVFRTGQASITMKKNGEILISGKDFIVKMTDKIKQDAKKDFILKGLKMAHN